MKERMFLDARKNLRYAKKKQYMLLCECKHYIEIDIKMYTIYANEKII